jgi:hypothetical protein
MTQPTAWPERLWVYEKCVMDCVDRGWLETRPGPDDSRFRARGYVRADVAEGRVAREAEWRGRFDAARVDVKALVDLLEKLGVEGVATLIQDAWRGELEAKESEERRRSPLTEEGRVDASVLTGEVPVRAQAVRDRVLDEVLEAMSPDDLGARVYEDFLKKVETLRHSPLTKGPPSPKVDGR